LPGALRELRLSDGLGRRGPPQKPRSVRKTRHSYTAALSANNRKAPSTCAERHGQRPPGDNPQQEAMGTLAWLTTGHAPSAARRARFIASPRLWRGTPSSSGGRRPARSRSWSGPTTRRNRPAPLRRGQDFEARTRPSQARPARLLSPECAGDGQVGRDFGRPGPSCSMTGLTSPTATFSAHTASRAELQPAHEPQVDTLR